MSQQHVSKEREISLSDVGRSVLNSIVLITTSLLLLAVSCLAFFFFYHHNVPAIGVQNQVHLQHHLQDNPYALVDLEFSTSKLTTAQPYNVIVELVVPDTPANHALGNFMVGVSMLGTDSAPIIESFRSSILRYSSPIIDTANTLLQSGPIMLGLRDESQVLRIPVLENYQFEAGWLVSPSQAKVEIFAPELRIYSCRLIFQTKMQGLPWILYTFKITSFVVFTSLFWVSSMLFMLLTWGTITLSTPRPRSSASRKKSASALSTTSSSSAQSSNRLARQEMERQRLGMSTPGPEDDRRSTYSVAPSSVETSFFNFDSDSRDGTAETEATSVGDQFVKIEDESE